MADINRKWKTWKYELKKRSFDSSLTIDEIVAAQTDSRVEKEDFRKLVSHWFCEEAQAISEKKKEIRSKSNEPHVLGTKSFAKLADEKKKEKGGVQPTRGDLNIISRTKKNGSIVNATAAKVIDDIKVIASGTSTSTSSTNTGIVDWSNDDLARVKGKEKGDHTRCVGTNIRMPKSKRSRVSQVPILKARINELEDEVKVMKENQAVILQFMANYKNQNPNGEFSNVLNSTKTKVANDSSSVDNHGPCGNSTTSGASKTNNSAKAITSPITHISSPQQRRKFLKEDGELKKLYVQSVMSGLLSENEFWSIRKVQKLVKERVELKSGMKSIIKPSSHCGQGLRVSCS